MHLPPKRRWIPPRISLGPSEPQRLYLLFQPLEDRSTEVVEDQFVLTLEPRLGGHQHGEDRPAGNFELVLPVQPVQGLQDLLPPLLQRERERLRNGAQNTCHCPLEVNGHEVLMRKPFVLSAVEIPN